MSLSSDKQTADIDACDAATILHYLGPKLDAMQDAVDKTQTMMEALSAGMKIQLGRSAPRSSCAFCTFEENRDSHHTARCTRYPDTVSRTVQASRLQLFLRCLKEAHADDCDVKCGSFGLDHNALLCTHRTLSFGTKDGTKIVTRHSTIVCSPYNIAFAQP
ncbi:unnamed protein product [Heligmosomoides polygyrus]|uniref:Reverse transcriptase n=1 Tax=Heligmosomoides polygyrus TaxID=6339 RepID=A0A183GUX0_HELPZ|nr:unnamed protein product [Heligmosomoides polygyrus]